MALGGAHGKPGQAPAVHRKKGLTNLCLCEIITGGFDSELTRAVRSGEGRRRKAEGGVRNAECGIRSAECERYNGHKQIGTRLASSLPCTAIYLMVIGRQGACSCESACCRKRDPDATDFHGPQLPTNKGLALHHLCKDKGLCSAECGVRKAEGRRQKAEGGKRKVESRRRRAEGGRQKAEGGKQKAESGRRKAESGRRKAE